MADRCGASKSLLVRLLLFGALCLAAGPPQTDCLHVDTPAPEQAEQPTSGAGQLSGSLQNCSLECSTSDYAAILSRVLAPGAGSDSAASILQRFAELERPAAGDALQAQQVAERPTCVRELVALIRGLATNELELKAVLQFAGEPSRASAASGPQGGSRASGDSGWASLDLQQIRWLNSRRLSYERGCTERRLAGAREPPAAAAVNASASASADSAEPAESEHASGDKTNLLFKLLASVDHWINALERFTLTQEWASLLKVFRGLESIVGSFGPAASGGGGASPDDKAERPSLAGLKTSLPGQVMLLTSSLNSLFPWHVWPWNNQDLYQTLDTFLSHGIVAFNKSTSGPSRLIELLPSTLRTLFQSFKLESFPRKCADWSQVICDYQAFHEKLVLGPAAQESPGAAEQHQPRRQALLQAPAASNSSRHIQELTCVMFRSVTNEEATRLLQQSSAQQQQLLLLRHSPANLKQLAWDRQVSKALSLYSLARQALSDQQWLAIYELMTELWAQQKVSDRLIMAGRVVQLLANCHTPKEMLESALWKDIYKYKNVLNQMIEILIEELNSSSESGQLSVGQLSLGSKSLELILAKFLRLLPTLAEALSATLAEDLPELVGKFFADKSAFFQVPCKGSSFADIIPGLAKHRAQIVEIEELVCHQWNTKPVININNFTTNDFFAMALNFSTFGNSLYLPKILAASSTAAGAGGGGGGGGGLKRRSVLEQTAPAPNASSIVDEMAANPRLAQVVAILQSSALDPPEVHAELPALDWVEAGTSVALLYESVQRLMSLEGPLSLFPELDGFQASLADKAERSRRLLSQFSKQDPIRLTAYALDTLLPVALRTFKPAESFHAECAASFRDVLNEVEGAGNESGKATRQWQCLVSSTNFAAWAINKFMRTFNEMTRNILAHMATSSGGGAPPARGPLPFGGRRRATASDPSAAAATATALEAEPEESCILFDGSISIMLDHLPQSIDLALETVLLASTTSEQQLNLYDIMCSSSYMLDPFNERAVELKAQMKDKMCHLFSKNSTTNCARVLRFKQWTQTMKELNETWFEETAIGLAPSFRDIVLNAHELLELFGRFKPSTLSDSLVARLLNVNSFWNLLMNRVASIVDKYQEKRFEYALQTLTPIIYDNLPAVKSPLEPAEVAGEAQQNILDVRESLIAATLGAKAILDYLERVPGSNSSRLLAVSGGDSTAANSSQQLEAHIQTLFSWLDQYSQVSAEALLRTLAVNTTKLESIFQPAGSGLGSSAKLEAVWRRFCSEPADTYLELSVSGPEQGSSQDGGPAGDGLLGQLRPGKEKICAFGWKSFYQLLGANSSKLLADYPERQLTRIMLTKWGQLFDVMFIESKSAKQLPKFFYMNYWDSFRDKIPLISPIKEQPSNLAWIWQGFEKIMNAMDGGRNETSGSLIRILDQLNCGLDAVKGGLSWENIANIYSDKQDILAAHSIINNGFALASIGINTFLAQSKFQRFLDELVRPKVGLNAFCELRSRDQLEGVFSVPAGDQYVEALESFQELICDTNFETLAQNINPISVCYQIASSQPASGNSSVGGQAIQQAGGRATAHPLADMMDRFFKLASLAVLDAKLVVASEAKPPLLDKNQWASFWGWWSQKGAECQLAAGSDNIALALVRLFQLLDSVNAEHVVWRAFFRSVHELSEMVGYLLRALQKKQHEANVIGRLTLVKEAASKLDRAIRSNRKLQQQQQLASTLSNVMFPEVNNFISYRTFKQLRYIQTVSDYFALTPGAQEDTCRVAQSHTRRAAQSGTGRKRSSPAKDRLELIGYKLNSNDKLYTLLCHYHSSQWLTALNIVVSSRTSSLTKKIDYMARYLAAFSRLRRRQSTTGERTLDSFIFNQQLEHIETVANTTLSYLLQTSQSLAGQPAPLSFSKVSNMSWHSLPNLLDSIDRQVCANKHGPGTFRIPQYEPRKLELEVVVCKMPRWNASQVYEYVSENFDLQNMISLIEEQGAMNDSSTRSNSIDGGLSERRPIDTVRRSQQQESRLPVAAERTSSRAKSCVTPFKFASRWLKIGQELADDLMSKASRDKIRKCMSSNRKGQSVYQQVLRYLKSLNGILKSVDELTSNNSWHAAKKTWNSISQLLINQQNGL